MPQEGQEFALATVNYYHKQDQVIHEVVATLSAAALLQKYTSSAGVYERSCHSRACMVT